MLTVRVPLTSYLTGTRHQSGRLVLSRSVSTTLTVLHPVHPTQAAQPTVAATRSQLAGWEADFSAFRLPVGALRLLRLVGRVYDRAGNGVRCGVPNVTSLPPLPNDASVPWQFREA